MISATAIVFVFIATLTYYIWFRPEKKNLPPGPWALPVIGNLHQFGRTPYITLTKWVKDYGDMYKIQLAGNVAIVLNDHKLAKELLSQEAFAGRLENMHVIDMYDDGKRHGVIGTDGEHWEQLRRFVLRQLRDFGFGKQTMESYIMDELQETLEWMKSQKGQPIKDIRSKLTISVLNSLWTIINGKRCGHDDKILLSISENNKKFMKDVGEKGGALLFAPWVRHIIPEWSGYNMVRKLMNERIDCFGKAVAEHEITYSDDYARDLIDVFLKEMKETKDPKSAFYGEIGVKHLMATVADLFGAGSDTTSTTLAWTLLYLSTFLEVQIKLQAEIEAITGNTRDCLLSDRPQMLYTGAVISEVLRYSSMVPILLHRLLTQKEVKGYTLPKNSIIMTNNYHIHRNPLIWGDPENFRPDRFLSPDGKILMKNEALLAFSIGRRQCLGEPLARDTLFLFITNIFQKFTVKLNPGEVGDLTPEIGPVFFPKPFEIILEERLV